MNFKKHLIAIFLIVATTLVFGLAGKAYGNFHSNIVSNSSSYPEVKDAKAVNLTINSHAFGPNAFYKLTDDGTLTIKFYDRRGAGTTIGRDFDQNYCINTIWKNDSTDIRSYVKKIIFVPNNSGVKFDFGGYDISYMFSGFTNLEEIDFTGVKDGGSYVRNVKYMFQNCKNLKKVDLSWMKSNHSTSEMQGMFSGCNQLEEVILNNPGFITRNSQLNDNATLPDGEAESVQMQNMFQGCEKLKYVDMSNITIYGRNDWTQVKNMFKNCYALEEVHFNNTKFPNVTNFSSMFENCSNLKTVQFTCEEGEQVAPNAVYMQNMFKNCTSLENLDLSHFGKLEWIRNMSGLLENCTNLKVLNIDNLDNSHIGPRTNGYHSFYEDNSVTDNNVTFVTGASEYGRDLGLKTCTSLQTISAKNSNIWMCNNNRGLPGNEYFDASSDEAMYYFTQKQMTFKPDAVEGLSVNIKTKRNYVDLITDRDGTQENMPLFNGLTDIADRSTNINIKDGDLNLNGPSRLPAGVYTILDTDWEEYEVAPEVESFYRISYLQQKPYVISGGDGIVNGDNKKLILVDFTDNGGMDTHVNTISQEWPTSGDYEIDLSSSPLVFTYENAAIDVNGKLHNVSIAINKITYKDLEKIPARDNNIYHNNNRYYNDGANSEYFRPVLRATQGDGIMFLNYARKGNPENGSLYNDENNYQILTGGSGMEIDFKVTIDDANPNTTFVFNSNDLDIPATQDWYIAEDHCFDSLPIEKVTYGRGGESFVLGAGNVLSTITFAENTGLMVIDDNTIVTTGSDPTTSWSEFAVQADANGANYTWISGIGCTTYGLRDTKPLFIDTVSVPLAVKKTLTNGTLAAGAYEFEMELKSTVPEGAPVPNNVTFPMAVSNNSAGVATFTPLLFKKQGNSSLIYQSDDSDTYYPGTSPEGNTHGEGTHNSFTYNFEVYENIPADADKDPVIAYDETKHTVQITVIPPENDDELQKGIKAMVYVDGELKDSIFSKEENNPLEITSFVNEVNKIQLVKHWDDDGSSLRPSDIEGFVEYELGSSKDTLTTEAAKWVKEGDTWTYNFDFPVEATVTDWGENVTPTGYDFAKGSGANKVYEMTNTIQKFDISMTNTVTGSRADTDKDFTFNISIPSLASKKITVTKTTATGPTSEEITFDTEGKYVTTLKHNESIVLPSLPYGTTYSVVESNYDIYAVSSVLTYGSNTTNFNDETVTEQTLQSDHNIVYTNEIGSIKLEKTWADENNVTAQRPEDVSGFIKYTYNNAETTLTTNANDWVKNGNVWTQEFDFPTTATVTDWGETTVPSGYTFAKGNNENGVCKITNTLNTQNLIVSKTVTGGEDARHTNKAFTFTITTSLPNRTITTTKGSESGTITTNANGVATFTLKHGESITLQQLPYGTQYSIAESDYGIYAVTSTLTNDNTTSNHEVEVPQQTLFADHNVAYTNSIRVIKLEKTWADENDITSIRPDDLNGFINYTYNNENLTLTTETDNWVKEGNVWTYEFDFPTTATVTDWGEETTPTGYEFAKGEEVNGIYKMTNTLQKHNVQVSNTVVGGTEERHTSKDFTFTVTTSLPNRTVTVKKTTSTGTTEEEVTTDANGRITTTLKHGESLEIVDLPHGSTYSITESDYDIYNVSSVLTNDNETQNYTGANVPQQTLESDHNIVYTNAITVIKLEKTWVDYDNSTNQRPDDISGFIDYTYNNQNLRLTTSADNWVKNGNVWTQEFDFPTAATVNNWGETVVPVGYEFEKGSVVDGVYKITNSIQKYVVTIKNNVSGAAADKTKDFTYTIEGMEPNITISYTKSVPSETGYYTTESTFTSDADGKIVFTLKHDETVYIPEVPYGAVYSISESGYTPYTVSSNISYYEGSTHKNEQYTDAIPEHTVKSDHYIVFTNLLQYENVVLYDVEPKLTLQKRLMGRLWKDTDSFLFALVPDDEDNPMPTNIHFNPDNGVYYSPLIITADSAQGTDEYYRKASFGSITFTPDHLDLANGETSRTFTYHVRELHPSEGGQFIDEITYSISRFKISVTLYIDDNNNLAVTEPVYQKEVVRDGITTLSDATLPFTFTNVYNKVKKVHRLDAEKALTTIGVNKHLENGAYTFVLKPVGTNADKAPMPAATVTLTDGSRQFTTINEGHAIHFYDEQEGSIDEDDLGDGLLFDLEVLRHDFTQEQLENGVEFEYEISEQIPEDCTNNGDGTWQRTDTIDGVPVVEYYDGIVHYRMLVAKYILDGTEGAITVSASNDDHEDDFYYTDQEKTQTHILTDEEKVHFHMLAGVPLFHNYVITTREIEVSKQWDDYDDIYGIRPNTVTVRLLRDGVFTGKTVSLSEANNWTAKFEALPMGDINGTYSYTVEEVVPRHYEPTYTTLSPHQFSISNRVVSLGDDAVCGTIVGEDKLSENPTIACEDFTDSRDGQQYKVERINGYCWMAENLRYEVYGAKTYKSNLHSDENDAQNYGYLYTWKQAANLTSDDAEPVYINGHIKGICPSGWHLPSATEIEVLRTYDAYALKSTEQWVDEGTNASKFNALPAGYYNANTNRFEGRYTDTYYLTEDKDEVLRVMYGCCRTMIENNPFNNSFSIRCVKNL